MSKLLVSHLDLDGLGSIVLAKYYEKELDIDDIISVDYGFEQDRINWRILCSYDSIVFADMTIPKESAEELISMGKELVFFDHHENSRWIQELEGSVWDKSRCGTKLFFEYYVLKFVKRYPPIILEFVALVDTYDLWKQDSPLWNDAKNLNNVMFGMKNYVTKDFWESYQTFFGTTMLKFEQMDTWQFTSAEKLAIEKANKKEQDVYRSAMKDMSVRKDSKGFTFGVCKMPSKISLVASKILEDRPDLDYLIVFNMYGGLTGKISVRTRRDDFDCTKIGIIEGHVKASGGTLTEDKAFQFLTDERMALAYNDEISEDDYNSYFRIVV
jgi:oligoribonuclease NrnB/cAMP/cGMP phosphodiesterase (DHH superfamily)